MRTDEKITRKMLSLIRESKYIIKEDDSNVKTDSFVISKNDSQFGDIKTSQEETFIKTVGEGVDFDDNSLIYYPIDKDLVLTGKIKSLNLDFEFHYVDRAGDGCYITVNSLQLTETNNKTLGKIRNAYVNWKNSLIEDSDLLDRLHKKVQNN
jgi:hypothetical protein